MKGFFYLKDTRKFILINNFMESEKMEVFFFFI